MTVVFVLVAALLAGSALFARASLQEG